MKLICVFCRWCSAGFCVCQSCWRGQAYCCDKCRKAGCQALRREAQRRYRQTKKGKKSHRHAENRRRHKKIQADKTNMDDHTSTLPTCVDMVSSQKETAVIIQTDRRSCCHFCGRAGEIVHQFDRRDYGKRVLGRVFQTPIQEQHNETTIYTQ